jgi:DNA-binding NarL/FixJ family response regulator
VARPIRKLPIRAELIDGNIVFFIPVRLLVEGQPIPQEMFSQMLTPQERKIFDLLCEGKQNKEIAGAVFLSLRTVKFHVSSLLKKTGCRSRMDLVMRYGPKY